MRRSRLVGPLWRWHRRAGLLAALFLLFLAITGVMLNHGADLGLDRRTVGNSWLRALYGDNAHAVLAFAAGPHWIAQASGTALWFDERSIGGCEGRLVGAREWQGAILAACERELLLLSAQGERIDSLGSASGLDQRIGGLALGEGEALLVQADGRWRRFDTEHMELGRRAQPTLVAGAESPPAQLAAVWQKQGGWLTWERLLLDLHSGRVFGRFGMLAVDVTGVLSIVLASSGVTIWSLRRRARKS